MHNILIRQELYDLCYLEEEFCFLSSIGLKLLVNQNDNEIEGYIRAPNNSPYKNGIFNFIIKIPEEYPIRRPELQFKNKIFHPLVNKYDKFYHCCISILNNWEPGNDLSMILAGLYEFFLFDNEHGYSNEATILYGHNIYEFEKKMPRIYNAIFI